MIIKNADVYTQDNVFVKGDVYKRQGCDSGCTVYGYIVDGKM